MADSTDRILVEDTLRGDEFAFAELVKRYQTAIWRTVRRRLSDHFASEDAVQEVFLRAYTSLHKFDTNRPFNHWLMRIATNYCIDVLRHRRIEQSWLCSQYQEMRPDSCWYHPPQQSSWSASELRKIAGLLIDALNPKNRNAFVLRELEGLDYGEVARALQISPLAARTRVFRARKEMQNRLRHHLPAEFPAAPC
jgi:RNA polymerase sigma-70 factor (ECF subfamily)